MGWHTFVIQWFGTAGRDMTPEQEARESIDQMLIAAGWHICDADKKKRKF